MAIRGRKPKPVSLKIVAGNPGHRPLNKNELRVELGVPECPEWLTDEAKKEWDRVIALYSEHGIITRIDGAQFAVYCQLYGQFVEAQITGAPFTANMIAQMRALASCFGLEPSSRGRLMGKNGKTGNKWSERNAKR